MQPKFTELNKVRIIKPGLDDCEGYVIASQFRGNRWIYKLSIREDDTNKDTFDTWMPEEFLEKTR